ncbi:MAG: hypothetical protein ACREXP_00145 [Steroidobacteraceae bacterium]
MMSPIGAAGATVTIGSGIVGFATEAIPVLQALSFFVGICVGIATIAWYSYQAYHLKHKNK